jgi:electron transport complex protein RnfG
MSNETQNSKNGTVAKIIKDAMVLFIITLISGVALGFVYEITLPKIEAAKLAAKTEAYQVVFPEAKEFVADDTLTQQASKAAETALIPNGLDGITIDEALSAMDASGKKIGYVMLVSTQKGYGGTITLSLGYTLDGTITGMEILTINETAGMGAKAAQPEFKSQFAGKKVEQFEVTKTGATADNQIDAISGATITSKAVTNAVNAGIRFITDVVEAGN